jgi:predicted lipoprotein with Yx(FWY)xxD motif
MGALTVRARSLAGLAVLAVAIGAAGCATATNSLHSGRETIKSARIATAGQALVDHQGRTLYVFARDSRNESTCYGACASIWPPVLTAGKPQVEGAVASGKLGTYKREDGGNQVTYDGHPLYYYQADTGPGDAHGQAINQFGAEWYAISPGGQIAQKGGSS